MKCVSAIYIIDVSMGWVAFIGNTRVIGPECVWSEILREVRVRSRARIRRAECGDRY